ncbi:MAG: caspase family protein, partial [Saprospiraceae bacterium]
MIKNFLLLLACLSGHLLSAQTASPSPSKGGEKGATPLSAPSALEGAGGRLRAVVIGISDYQSPTIPDLRFADRDAATFADWLRSPAGGSLPEANIQVLLNSDATAGKIIAALGGLVSDCKPGDQAVIYFSGHGDVERISKFQRGYWLTWDSPPAVYAA